MCKLYCFMPPCSYPCWSSSWNSNTILSRCTSLPNSSSPFRGNDLQKPFLDFSLSHFLCSHRVIWTLFSEYCAKTPSQQDCTLKALIGSHPRIPNTEQNCMAGNNNVGWILEIPLLSPAHHVPRTPVHLYLWTQLIHLLLLLFHNLKGKVIKEGCKQRLMI